MMSASTDGEVESGVTRTRRSPGRVRHSPVQREYPAVLTQVMVPSLARFMF
jgi:hypothetical protein